MKNFLISKILVLFNYNQNLNIILNISGNIKLDSNFFFENDSSRKFLWLFIQEATIWKKIDDWMTQINGRFLRRSTIGRTIVTHWLRFTRAV